jgi:hypothetical protein
MPIEEKPAVIPGQCLPNCNPAKFARSFLRWWSGCISLCPYLAEFQCSFGRDGYGSRFGPRLAKAAGVMPVTNSISLALPGAAAQGAAAKSSESAPGGDSSVSFIDSMRVAAGAGAHDQSEAVCPQSGNGQEGAPRRGEKTSSLYLQEAKKETKEPGGQPHQVLQPVLHRQAIQNSLQASVNIPAVATIPALSVGDRFAVESIPSPAADGAAEFERACELPSAAAGVNRQALPAFWGGADSRALPATPTAVLSAQNQGSTAAVSNHGQKQDPYPSTELANTSAGVNVASGPNATDSQGTRVAASAERQTVQADARARKTADAVALLPELDTSAGSEIGSISALAQSGGTQDSLSARGGGAPLSGAPTGGTRTMTASALPDFNRIATGLAASGGSAQPGSESEANGTSVTGRETFSAGAAQEAKQQGAAIPARDSKSESSNAIQLGNSNPAPNQGPVAAGAQNTLAAPANFFHQAVTVNHGAQSDPVSAQTTAGLHQAGSEPSARSQNGETGGADLQALAPAVNSAQLVQRAGGSELRVGVHSNDFGNVSISTLGTRNLISAQISLDHGELAKAIAAHLPEVQARLGAGPPLEMRISTTQPASSRSGSMTGGLGQDAGQGQRYSASGQNHAHAAGLAEQKVAAVSLPATAVGENSFDRGRLDIRA